MDHAGSRRELLTVAALAGVGVVLGAGDARAENAQGKPAAKPADVNPTEDMMREHGVLRRVLLVYQEGVRRLGAGNAPPPDVFASAAGIIHRFIEGYHEQLEERFVFPRLEKAGKLVELCKVLREQHAAGRKLTSEILKHATAAGLASAGTRQSLVAAIDQLTRMYEPHAAREDTELFPAFHALFTEAEFDKLGDVFEDEEHKALGSGGFEGTVKEVAQLEKALGINDLAKFTPR